MNTTSTIKLYDQTPYATTFEGSVVAVEKLNENKLDIILDRTIFFPEEGGQSSDTGTITIAGVSYPVEHVRLEQRDGVEVLHHIVELAEGGASQPEKNEDMTKLAGLPMAGQINWSDRYDKMQNHSGEHVLSGIIHREYGYDNVGFHLNDDIFTMDFNGTFNREQVEHIEATANAIVYENVPIEAQYYENDELDKLEYRSKKSFDTAVRIVTIGDYDACACCAPHVGCTGEIGIIKIMKWESWKGGTRFTVLCGQRAYKDYARKQALLQELVAGFSTSEDKLAGIIDGLRKSLAEAEHQLSVYQTEGLYRELIEAAENTDGRPVIVFTNIANAGAIRSAVDRAMSQRPEYIFGAMSGDDESGYRYLIGSRNVDVKATMSEAISTLGGKGGGNQDMIQGMLKTNREQIEKVFK